MKSIEYNTLDAGAIPASSTISSVTDTIFDGADEVRQWLERYLEIIDTESRKK